MKKPTPVDSFAHIVTSLVRSDQPDLNMRHMAALLAISGNTGARLSVKDLAERLNVNKPSMTRSLDRLEELNFVTRYRSYHDGRLVEASLTAEGADYLLTLAGFADGAAVRAAA